MSFKKLFFKDTGEDKAPEEPKKQPTKSAPKPTGLAGQSNLYNNQNIPPLVVPPSHPTPNGTDYNQHFEGVLNQKNKPGLDFREFSIAIESLNGQPFADQQKYQFTFPTYQASGITPDKLVESANYYLTVLEQEHDQFQKEMDNAKIIEVDNKRQNVENLKTEIQKLTEQIQQKTQLVQQMNQEAQVAEQGLIAEEASFMNFYNHKVSQIQNHIQNIKTFLNANTTR